MLESLVRFTRWIENLSGFKRSVFSCIAGILLAITLPPLFVFPLLFASFSVLYILLQSSVTHKRAFWDGWSFGFGFFVAGIYWITISLFTDIAQFWWLVPLALVGLPIVLAIYIGLFGVCMSFIKAKGYERLFWFASLWCIFEVLRGFLFTGFPWNLIGYSWTFSLPIIQSASVIGSYGLGWITILLSASPALLLLHRDRFGFYAKTMYAQILVWFLIALWGLVRLENNPAQYTDTSIRIVQANIAQSLKWDPREKHKNLEKHIAMSDMKNNPVDLVIWPETAFPYYLRAGDDDSQFWRDIIPSGTTLLSGAVRTEGRSRQDYKVFNSLVALDSRGERVATYDKNHLVPFGEYVPFREFLPLPKITQGAVDFSTGDGDHFVHVDGIPNFVALICYEAIFPSYSSAKSNADWILNITNDAWFGNSSGPYQHFHMAQMRAVEQGLPLVRAANTGMSAVFDPMGRAVNFLPLSDEGVINSLLPKRLASRTIYTEFGNHIMIIISLMFLLYFSVRRVNLIK